MNGVAVTLVVLIVIVVLAALAYAVLYSRRRALLQQRFGPEYQRAVDETGDRREAEKHLADVAHRRDKLELKEITPQERAAYTQEWEAVQARFVDEPASAVDAADVLLTRVMRERGYPVDDFEDRADLVAADHPDVVEHYRAAHLAHERHRSTGGADTEDLRQAFVHYRSLFDALVGVDRPAEAVDSVGEPPAAAVDETSAVDAPATDVDVTGEPVTAPEREVRP